MKVNKANFQTSFNQDTLRSLDKDFNKNSISKPCKKKNMKEKTISPTKTKAGRERMITTNNPNLRSGAAAATEVTVEAAVEVVAEEATEVEAAITEEEEDTKIKIITMTESKNKVMTRNNMIDSTTSMRTKTILRKIKIAMIKIMIGRLCHSSTARELNLENQIVEEEEDNEAVHTIITTGTITLMTEINMIVVSLSIIREKVRINMTMITTEKVIVKYPKM